MTKTEKFIPQLSRDELERRRLLAGQDLLIGMKQCDVAKKYNVDKSNVSRWKNKLKAEGLNGLMQSSIKRGAKSKLSNEQRNKLKEIIITGSKEYGFDNELWTLDRIVHVIKEEFGVTYHPGRVWHILKNMGFTWQKPKYSAIQKDHDKVNEWLETSWEYVKKT